MVGWEDILKNVAEHYVPSILDNRDIAVKDKMDPDDLDRLEKEGAKDLKKHSLTEHRTCGPDRPLAWYEPASSKHRIVYCIDRIIDYADKTLADILDHLKIKCVSRDVVRCWRLAFLSFIRRHEMFHYLFERGSRLLEDGRNAYNHYRNKVYGPRYGKEGNLEEALAEAYAAVWCKDELERTFEIRQEAAILPLESLCRDLKVIFLEKRRIAGYEEARHFLDEMEKLYFNRDLPIIHPLQTALSQPKLLYDKEITEKVLRRFIHGSPDSWHTSFKGLAWLFYELHTGKQSPFNTNERDNPPRPFSTGIFVAFLANIQKLHSVFETLLPPPDEETRICEKNLK